jgi:hypothetical protein
MSYIFKLRDSQARGKTRYYAFTMLMTDRVFLVSCWPFLVKYVSYVTFYLPCSLSMRFFLHPPLDTESSKNNHISIEIIISTCQISLTYIRVTLQGFSFNCS